MLCFIAIRFSRRVPAGEVTMQVKRAIVMATLQKTTNIEHTRVCVEPPHCCLFSNYSKSSTIRLRSLYITFYLCSKMRHVLMCPHRMCPHRRNPRWVPRRGTKRNQPWVPTMYVPVLLAMQWSVALKSAFYRGQRKHLWSMWTLNRG